ncbi:hypothetical protein PLICRDRAFT_403978 [Plicaturopsis crispa FD-325 SS-3]|nr:hypothetical protein PLICRDRAFT_403978 [Plicaturopsis crispa FD-325 SS-3]
MPSLASFVLSLFHFLYSCIVAVSSIRSSLRNPQPRSLTAQRRRIPAHLALLLVGSKSAQTEETERAFLECVERTVDWCRTVGIETLTVYDSEGVGLRCSRDIQERVHAQEGVSCESGDSDVEYPLTPPLSDHSESHSTDLNILDRDLGTVTLHVNGAPAKRNHSRVGVLKRRRTERQKSDVRPLTLHLTSRESSKPALASIARSYIVQQQEQMLSQASRELPAGEKFHLSVEELNSVVQGSHGFPAPDLMIVHPIYPSLYKRVPLHLYGFPPWQIRLTEIHYNEIHSSRRAWSGLIQNKEQSLAPVPLDEIEFREALDEFAGAEMRLGK